MSLITISSEDYVHMVDDNGLPLCGIHHMTPMTVLRRYLDYVDVRIAVKMTDNVYRITCPNCLERLKERLYPNKRS